ncbi:hypothetical protein HPP92_006478 [Vanilla planifolia]|uniref:Uncharacterized protein n=1 Tax=Vanilla planifolia TaxID=51239 RepID=A0A835RJZ3_VANPL|nr:hypothetical protein HPP92_006739 [Vanilla planifolia]KAG0489615.1 hypothetical protein HPP92_006478 [Vanilla planifolia]
MATIICGFKISIDKRRAWVLALADAGSATRLTYAASASAAQMSGLHGTPPGSNKVITATSDRMVVAWDPSRLNLVTVTL